MWAGKYDEPLKDVFAVQDRAARQIVGALGVSIRDVERERALRKAPKDLNAYDLVLRAGQVWAEISPAEHLKFRNLVEEAVSLDPAYARAQTMLAFAYLDEYRWKYNPHPARPDPLASALERAELAVRLDPADAYTHYALGKTLYPEFPNNWEFQANVENLSQNYKAVADEGFRKVGLFNLEAEDRQ